ncbi:MAG: hypothetical protein Q9M17_08400 [Mariprofundus sp.]|nr:hypothetical protein [Mariprofundus sp.]
MKAITVKGSDILKRVSIVGALSFLLVVLFSIAIPVYAGETTKQLVGAVGNITIKEAGVSFESRIDTGAESSSFMLFKSM